ncbi:MAG: UbiA family prenyltransferase [Candidatus Marinimicrobia bacterium]|jgi:geranylgeranylglycerol-phosphate geranylgeranyltransferase|nr:UbiA family prenyltransferase [Candidatus Neomarinimicrobiota bacterium]MBT4827933.1 UbiA family prenyltransferase [Candidatus Neomarinimicrobiota bacterium]MBT5226132.1 UbiA family prenyltransferase [Candidatus Neomarinimicrobiota bacterium]MBT7519775.1 UbiA family prenyltransferase [Candidatus Neomarinimicrobiota bacterium]
MDTFFYHIKLLRPLNVFTSGLAMVIGSGILGTLNDTGTLLLVMAVVMCFAGAANALNDVVDYEIDKINRPMRPLPSGFVKKRTALFISILLFSMGTLACLELSEAAKVIGIVIAMPFMVLYSKYLKGMPLIGNMIVAFILGLSFLFCGAAFNNISPMWIPMILAFGLTLVRELVKDIADMEGDQSVGLKTFPITAGIEKSIQLSIFLSACIGMGAFIPYLYGTYGIWYGILLILGVEIPLGVVVVSLLNNPGISSATHGARILKFSTLIGLIAIYAGTF